MQPYPPPAPRGGRSGATVVVAVLLWVFVGWPLSWLLLALFFPLGILFGVGITVGLVVLLATSGRRPAPPVVLPPAGPVTPAQAVRREVESYARVNAVGGCGWCGAPSAHVTDEGYAVAPRHWHAAEIEERIRTRLAG